MDDKKRNVKFNMTIGCLMLILIMTVVVQLTILKHGINNLSNERLLESQEIQNAIEEEKILQVEKNETEVASIAEESNVDKVIDKIQFEDFAEASIYKVGDFTRETIPNDLILRLGFYKALRMFEIEHIDTETPFYNISKLKIEEGIKELFGNDIKYKHDKFMNIDVETFNGFYEIRDTVKPIDEYNYEYVYYEGGGGDTPFIHQEICDVTEAENKIELKVKVAFVDTVYDETQKLGLFKYHIYKDFNFDTDEFQNELLVIEDNQYDYVENYGTTKCMANILDKLNTYSYIFEKNNETGEYYLSEFHKNQM